MPNISPRCEGCGYDLTHRPADNRCPECGLNIATSLGPNPRRFGTLWQQQLEQGDPSVLAWFGEARRVLRQPSEYYAQLRLRPERDPGAVFVAGTYIAIGIVACAWFFIMSYGEYSPDDWAAFFLSAAFGTWVAWGCWFGHRLLGSAAFTGWLLGRTLPDSRWAEKVIAYESVFLWAFVAFWLPLVTSYVYAGPWISMTIAAGRRGNTPLFIRGIPLEVLVFIGGTCLLGGLWLWRYHRIGRAIRWSNF